MLGLDNIAVTTLEFELQNSVWEQKIRFKGESFGT